MTSKLFIVLPVHNRIQSTRTFLASLAKQTCQNFEVVICDDGSTDGTGDCLAKEHPEVRVLKGTGNLWWTAGINRCIEDVLARCANEDYILTVNNDNTLPANYLEQKLQRAKEYPNTIIGSLCVFDNKPDVIETSGYIMNFTSCRTRILDRNGSPRTAKHQGTREVTHLPGKGVLLPAAVYRKIGLYDHVLLPQYHADTDLTLRACKAGFRVLVDYDSIVYSEVNINNMVVPNQPMTLRAITKTFQGRHSMNNFEVYNNFAKKHCAHRRYRYLAAQYSRTCLGLLRRYALSKLKALRR